MGLCCAENKQLTESMPAREQLHTGTCTNSYPLKEAAAVLSDDGKRLPINHQVVGPIYVQHQLLLEGGEWERGREGGRKRGKDGGKDGGKKGGRDREGWGVESFFVMQGSYLMRFFSSTHEWLCWLHTSQSTRHCHSMQASVKVT